MNKMDIFNIVAGGASILSLLISIFVANKVIKINNSISNNESVKSKQSVKAKSITQSEIKQSGRDIK